MANQDTTPTADLEHLVAQLAEPFEASEIKWRVTHSTQDGSRGAVIPFADPRAYTDRLNQVVTPTGWTRHYEVVAVSALTRLKRDKVIQSGKVLVTCTLTIHGLGCHSGSGEDFADEPNAMTAAEAQAFKRAATCFGLGRYLYNFAEMWVPLNQYRQPLQIPPLPKWALPRPGGVGEKANAAAGVRPPVLQKGPIDPKTTTTIEGFGRILGTPIYGEILWRIGRARRAHEIPNAQLQVEIADAMERAARGLRKAHLLADHVGDSQFVQVLDGLRIESMNTVPNLATLKLLVGELESIANQQAA
jgi:hypothetical protein